MPRRITLPPELSDRPFSTIEAHSRGVPRGRLRGPDLDRPARGVRVVAGRPSPDGPRELLIRRAVDISPSLPPGAFFCGAAALALHGLPIPGHALQTTDLDVGVVAPLVRIRRAGIVSHRFDDRDVIEVDGILVASPIATWVDCAARFSERDVVLIGDGLVRRTYPFATIPELKAAVASRRKRRGVRRLDAAVARVRERTDSPRETLLRLDLVDAGLPEPEVNVPICDRGGAQIALGDLVYSEYRILVEYDGAGHFDDSRQFHRDIERLDNVMAENWRVIRVNKSHTGDEREAMIRKVERALRNAGWRPTPPPSAETSVSASKHDRLPPKLTSRR